MNVRIQSLRLVQRWNWNLRFSRYYRQDKRVVVTGLGVVCPLGNDLQTAWNNLINGECRIHALEGDEFNGIPCRVAATVDTSTIPGYDELEEFTVINESVKFAVIAAAEALTDSGLDVYDKRELNVMGMSFGSQLLDIDTFIKSYESFEAWKEDKEKKMDRYALIRQLLHLATSVLSFKYAVGGPIYYPNAGAASGVVAIGEGFRAIQEQNNVDIMICGASGTKLSPFYLALLSKLGVLSTNYNDNPIQACRPFDRNRDGEVFGEGAGVLILEELEHAVLRNARIYCEIKGFGVTSSIQLKTIEESNVKGIMTAMKKALIEAHFAPEYVSYINAHGSGCLHSDYYEARAIQKLFGDRSWELFVSSTKGAHGNLGTATSAVETVFTALAIHTGILPPTLNCESNEFLLNFLPERVVDYYSRRKIVLKNSRAFCGLNASLCMLHLDPNSVVVRN